MKKLLVMLLSLSAGAALLSGCSGNGQEAFEEKSYAVDAAEIAEVSIDVRDRTLTRSTSATMRAIRSHTTSPSRRRAC